MDGPKGQDRETGPSVVPRKINNSDGTLDVITISPNSLQHETMTYKILLPAATHALLGRRSGGQKVVFSP